MTQIFQRFSDWIKARPWHFAFLLSVLLLAAVIFLAFHHLISLTCFRSIGIAVELSGLLIVLLALSAENRKYKKNGFHMALILWIGDIRDVFIRRPRHASISGTASAHGAATAEAYARVKAPEGASIEQRVGVIESEINAIYDMVHRYRAEERVDLRKLRVEIDDVREQSAIGLAKVRNEIADHSVGDYYKLITGGWWTALGMIMTNLPDDVLKIAFGIP